MRISDLMISNNYLRNLNDIRDKISVFNRQILTGEKIEKPSDSPVDTSKILRIKSQLGQTSTYQKNIQNSLSFLNETSFALQSIQSEVQNIIGKITELKNPINQGNLELYADMIDNSLKIILDTSNSKVDGKYLFGGTDYSEKPFGISADNQSYQVNTDTSGKINVRLSQSIVQQINLPGADLFNTIVSSKGVFNKSDAIGTTTVKTFNVFDTLGNQYQLETSFIKTAANTYQLNYDIFDGGGASIFTSTPGSKTLSFDSLTGSLLSVDGSVLSKSFEVNDPTTKIQFRIDLSALSEVNSSSTSISLKSNQSMDIFNTLKKISDQLRNGILPSDEQISSIENFNARLTAKQSAIGNSINQISTIDDMLNQQNFNFQQAAQDVNGVDVAKTIIDLQNQDFLLQVSQKIAAKLLPQSLLDYL